MSRDIKITQDDVNPIAREVLAKSLVKISASFASLTKSGLNRRAIIALIADDIKLTKGTINDVLTSLESLEKNYTR